MTQIILYLATIFTISVSSLHTAPTASGPLEIHKSLLSKDKKSVTYYISWKNKKYEIKYSSIGHMKSQIQLKNGNNMERLIIDSKTVEYRGKGQSKKVSKNQIKTLLSQISENSAFLFERRFPIENIGIKKLYGEDLTDSQTQAILGPILVALYDYLTREEPACTEKSTCTCAVGNMQMTKDCKCDEYLLCIYGNIQRCRVTPSGDQECETSHICTAECVK